MLLDRLPRLGRKARHESVLDLPESQYDAASGLPKSIQVGRYLVRPLVSIQEVNDHLTLLTAFHRLAQRSGTRFHRVADDAAFEYERWATLVLPARAAARRGRGRRERGSGESGSSGASAGSAASAVSSGLSSLGASLARLGSMEGKGKERAVTQPMYLPTSLTSPMSPMSPVSPMSPMSLVSPSAPPPALPTSESNSSRPSPIILTAGLSTSPPTLSPLSITDSTPGLASPASPASLASPDLPTSPTSPTNADLPQPPSPTSPHPDLPPLAILMCWQAHLLNPPQYSHDLEGTYQWLTNVPFPLHAAAEAVRKGTLPDHVEYVSPNALRPVPSISGWTPPDISAAVQRHAKIVSGLSAQGWFKGEVGRGVQMGIVRYHAWLDLMSAVPNHPFLAPPVDIELVWRTHQLRGARYRAETEHLLGEPLDRAERGDDQSIKRAAHLWKQRFKKEYVVGTLRKPVRRSTV